MRGFDADAAAGAHEAVKFLHGAHDVGNVLDDVNGAQLVEGAVGERPGKAVEIDKDIGGAGGVVVDTDRAGVFADPAADIKDSQGFRLSIVRMMESECSAQRA